MAACPMSLACSSIPSVQKVEYEAVGVAEIGGPLVVGEWTIKLDRIDLAFGPVYFCAANFGSNALCDTAAAELLTDNTLSLTSSGEVPLGRVHGFTGAIRSASFDFGIHWFPSQAAPTPAATAPNGHSLVALGSFVRGAENLPFTLIVNATPQYAGQRFVPTRAVVAEVTEETSGVRVHFPLGAWLKALPVADLVTGSNGAPIVIDGSGPAHDAVLLEMVAGHPVTFEFQN